MNERSLVPFVTLFGLGALFLMMVGLNNPSYIGGVSLGMLEAPSDEECLVAETESDFGIKFDPCEDEFGNLDNDQKGDLQTRGLITQAVGSGSFTTGIRNNAVITGSSANSTVRARTHGFLGLAPEFGSNVINFGVRMKWTQVVQFPVHTPDGAARWTIGKDDNDGVGVLARDGFGFEVQDDLLFGLAHNGTTLDTVDLNTQMGEVVRKLTVVSDGEGNIEWFLGGVSLGTSSNGPSGPTTSGQRVIQWEAENLDDAASQRFNWFYVRYYVEDPF